jgi:small-conductance mechanosensitive channel
MTSTSLIKTVITQNTSEDWLFASVAVFAWLLIFYLTRTLLLRKLTHMAAQTATLLDDFFVDILSATRVLLASAVSLLLLVHFLNFPENILGVTHKIVIGLLLLQVGFWAERGLQFWLKGKFSPSSQDSASDAGSLQMTRSLLTFLGRVTLWIVVSLLILSNIGLNVTALLASMGIGGIAIALAVQNILGDLFASLSITIDKPFVIGDFITVGEFSGTVEHVGLKTTRLRSVSGEELIFSNNDLLSSRIRNLKRMQERRVLFTVGVTYDTTPEKMARIPALIQQAIESVPNTRFDHAHFKAFGASSMNFEVVYFINSPEFPPYMEAEHAINLALLNAFNSEGIEFAFPTQTLHIKSN